MLKKIIKIGFTNVMPSIIPILIWTILSVLYRNNEISKGFSITYPYQFLFMFLYAIFVQGQIKSEAKNHELGNRANSGILVFYIASIVVIVLTFIFRKQVLSYYKFDYRDYIEILMYGVIMLVCDYSVYCLTLIKQYREEHKEAFLTNVKWYGSRVLVVLIVRCFTSDYKMALIIVICMQIVILVMFVCRNVRFKKFGISIIDGLKYSMSRLPADVLMCLTYVFGYGNVTNIGGEYFTAYNIEALCTDTQWDILDSGIDTAVTTEICENGNKNSKNLRLCCVLYSLILFGTSAIMLLLYSLIFVEVDMRLVWKMFLIDCSTFPIYAIMYCEADKIVINNPTVLMAITGVIRYIARFIVTTTVASPFAISYGVLTSCLLGVVQWTSIYLYVNRGKKNE